MNEPLCFGLPSVINTQSPACHACSHNVDCGIACQRMLVSLSHHIDVTAEMSNIQRFVSMYGGKPEKVSKGETKHKTTIVTPTRSVAPEKIRIEPTEEQKKMLSELPVKVAEKMRNLIKTGVGLDAIQKVRNKKNPFDRDKHTYVSEAADMLLNGGLTRSRLIDVYMTKYGWTKGTSKSRATAAVQVLVALELAIEDGENVVLGPKVKAQD